MFSRFSSSLVPRLKLMPLAAENFNAFRFLHFNKNPEKNGCGLCNKSEIPSRDFKTKNSYLFQPMSTSSKGHLELDPKPDVDNDNSSRGLDLDASEGESLSETSLEPEEYGLYLNDEDLQKVTGGDPELIKKVKYIQLEHAIYRQEGVLVPSNIKLSRWQELLDLHSRGQRKRFYEFLFKVEMKQRNDKRKKEEAQLLREQTLGPKKEKAPDPYGIVYGLGQNTLFHRIYESTIAKFYHNKIFQEMKFGRPIIFDLGYDEHMNPREAKNCAKQIELTLTENRLHPQPFNIILCNAHRDLQVMKYLQKIIPTIYNNDYVIDIQGKSYLDLFPHKDIVYLSPHAREYLDEFNEDDVYIIGAMVDKTDPRPLSLAKAKQEGLRMKKLPLDKYLQWGLGGKSLTLNQMNNIMLEIRYTNDWMKAFRFVPTRKLRREEHQQNEMQSYRPQNRSQVLVDYELTHQNKGFQQQQGHKGHRKSNWASNSYHQPNQPQKGRHYNNNPQADIRSQRLRDIMRDDE